MKRLASLAFLAVCASQVGATDCGSILNDSGFDLWCGDQLCYWKLERGDIAQVPTWHDGDDGVSMIGDDVAISQRTAVNSSDTDCIQFDMVADVDATAEVRLEADVFGDGTIDWSERIPTSSWDAVSMRIGISGYYDGILFRLTKTGPGGATLAQIKAEVVDPEDGPCPSYLDAVPLPLGARCGGLEQCDEGVCAGGICSECADSAGCDSGEVCGREDHASGLLQDWYACIPAASRLLGELCYSSAECASGACTGDVCGECDSGTDCDGGACVSVSEEVGLYVCAGAARGSGEPCMNDGMCDSGVCDGTPLGFCDLLGGVGEPCFDDIECPAPSDFSTGTCTFVAVAGGTCQ